MTAISLMEWPVSLFLHFSLLSLHAHFLAKSSPDSGNCQNCLPFLAKCPSEASFRQNPSPFLAKCILDSGNGQNYPLFLAKASVRLSLSLKELGDMSVR